MNDALPPHQPPEAPEPMSADDFHRQQLGNRARFVASELARLPTLLLAGETVHLLAQGMLGNRRGLVAATNRRILFVEAGRMSGRSQLSDYPYNRIVAVQTGLTGGMLTRSAGQLTLITTSGPVGIAEVRPAEQAEDVGRFVREKITPDAGTVSMPGYHGLPTAAPPAPPSAPPPPLSTAEPADPAERLRKLRAMRDADLIDDAEYDRTRQRILDEM